MRNHTAMLTAGAPAALAVALLLGGCGQAGDADTDIADPSATATVTSEAPGTATGTSSATTGTAEAGDAEAAVRQWLTAAREGDLDALRAGLGSYSLQQAEGMGGLEGLSSGLAEGMSAFLDAEEWVVEPLPQQPGAFLVVASGEVTREGMTETAARSWLVHPENGDLVVETFAAPAPEVVAPLPAAALPATEPVEVLLPAGEVFVLVDGEDATAWASVIPDGERLQVRVKPPAGWSPGEHVVAVSVSPEPVAPDGAWASATVTFPVA